MRRFVILAACMLLAACNRPADSSAAAEPLDGHVEPVDYTTLVSEKADEASAAIDAADTAQQVSRRVGAVDARIDQLEHRMTALESRLKP